MLPFFFFFFFLKIISCTNSPFLYFQSIVQDNIYEWHFTIRGPSGTEFEGGIYHGRILLPPEYPFKPPNIVFLTVENPQTQWIDLFYFNATFLRTQILSRFVFKKKRFQLKISILPSIVNHIWFLKKKKSAEAQYFNAALFLNLLLLLLFVNRKAKWQICS